jgi:hypothetical protein
MHLCGVSLTAAAAVVATIATVATAGPASAEPLPALTSAIDDVRAASTCPPLVSDPLVVRSAELAAQETSDYLSHRSAVVPFSDPLPALKTIGYAGNKGELLSGYGENETDSIHGLVLEALSKVPDCSFTQYGVNASFEDGFVLTSVVLAGP